MSCLFRFLTCRPIRDLIGLSAAHYYSSQIEVPKFDEALPEWTAVISAASDTTALQATIGRAYDGTVTRATRVEAKAVGLLTVNALVLAAIALILPVGST